jgi:hypothetical protein
MFERLSANTVRMERSQERVILSLERHGILEQVEDGTVMENESRQILLRSDGPAPGEHPLLWRPASPRSVLDSIG